MVLKSKYIIFIYKNWVEVYAMSKSKKNTKNNNTNEEHNNTNNKNNATSNNK